MRIRIRNKPLTSIAAAAVLAAGVGVGVVAQSTVSLAAMTGSPYTIDGTVPGADGGTAITDPAGSTKELGPINSNSTKIGVIHTAPLPMLGLTNPNAQVDLNSAWLDLQRVNGKDFLYFAWQRDSNSGSGFIAYEFMHAAAPTACAYDTATQAQLIAGCNPWANRASGDFMILWDQQGGSRDLYKRVWTGTAPNLTLGAPVPLGDNALAQYSSDGFKGEAAVNLTDAGLTTGTDCTTLANTVPSTVTGNSDTADYKDTVLTTKRLSTCKTINIVKTDDAGAALGGAEFTLYHNVAPVAAPRSATDDIITDPALTCTTDTTTGLCSISSVPYGDYWVVETNTPANHDTAADQPVTVSSTSTTTSLTLTFVDRRQRGSILIRKTDGTNDLAGAEFSATLTGGTAAVNIPLVSGSGSLFCLDGLLLGGTYAIAETKTPPGYNGAASIPSVTVSTASTCAGRVAATSIVPDQTVTNNAAPGTINIAKTDDNGVGVALNGAVFTLYVDDDGDGTHQSSETTTQGSAQTTAGSGTAQFANVPLGKYCVVETTTPTGYSTAAPQCVTVGVGTVSAGTGQVINLTFVDPRKHRVIVLVCHEGSNTLDPSAVTVAGTTKNSLSGSGLTTAQQNSLCNLGGASFGGLDHGTVTPSVEIPTTGH